MDENENNFDNNVSDDVETDNSIEDDNVPDESDNTEDDDKEPENDNKDETDENNEDEEIPEKFRNEDGTLKANELLKAYKGFEKKQGETSKELGELRKKAEFADKLQAEREELARNYGYQDANAMQQAQEQAKYNAQIAQLEANEYAKHLNECDYPDEVRNLLIQYSQNPNPELLQTIQEEFGKDTLMSIAIGINESKRQLQVQQEALQRQQFEANARNYLEDVTNKYGNDLKDKATFELYGEAFKAFGTNLDTNRLMGLIKAIKQSAVQEYINTKPDETTELTDEISDLAPSNHSQNSSAGGKSILDMSESELRKMYKKYKDI